MIRNNPQISDIVTITNKIRIGVQINECIIMIISNLPNSDILTITTKLRILVWVSQCIIMIIPHYKNPGIMTITTKMKMLINQSIIMIFLHLPNSRTNRRFIKIFSSIVYSTINERFRIFRYFSLSVEILTKAKNKKKLREAKLFDHLKMTG